MGNESAKTIDCPMFVLNGLRSLCFMVKFVLQDKIHLLGGT